MLSRGLAISFKLSGLAAKVVRCKAEASNALNFARSNILRFFRNESRISGKTNTKIFLHLKI